MINLTWNKNLEKSLNKYITKIKKKLKKCTKELLSPELRNHKLSGKLKDLRAIV
jgi:mRNA-degrading endonuclease YafQ of YafQ-DinJ toxin-antitoxin module